MELRRPAPSLFLAQRIEAHPAGRVRVVEFHQDYFGGEDSTKNVFRVFIAAFCIFITVAALASGPMTPAPEYMPYCGNPQDIAPMQAAGG